MSEGAGPDVANLDDDALFRAYRDGVLVPKDFVHAVHVRLAFIYLRREPDFGEAALAFRRDLKRFAHENGVGHIYHETLTWAYLALLAERMHDDDASDSREFLQRFPDLARHRGGALERYYDLERITASKKAREVFVLPTRASDGA